MTQRTPHDEGTRALSIPFIRLRRFQRPDVWESSDVLLIGRHHLCHVRLDDPSVSRHHATIRYKEGQWLLVDTGSSNGTFLNKVRLESGDWAVLSRGNSVRFGDVVLIVESTDVVTEAEWFSRRADPSQMLALLRQHPLSHLLPSIEKAIEHLKAEKFQSICDPYLWSPSNTNPSSMHGGGDLSITGDESDDVRWFVLHEAVRHPFHSFGGLATGILAWNDRTVVHLAKTIWASSDFSLMPILADALEDAGCDEQDILTHFRRSDRHLRCCWALRAVLVGEPDYHV